MGMTFEGSLDVDLFNRFMAEFLRFNSENLFRSKGVLSFEGQERKFVFQVRRQTLGVQGFTDQPLLRYLLGTGTYL